MCRLAIACVVATALFSSCPAAAQRGQGASGGVDLTVRINLPNGHPAPDQLRVELVTDVGTYVAGAMTESQGRVTFLQIGAGNYRLRVTGPGIEDTVSEVFNIISNERSHLELVNVNPEAGSAQEPPYPSGSVAVVDLHVPDKAKKEFGKGTDAMSRQDWPAALKCFQKAVEIYPSYASAYNNLGVVLMNSGRPAQGREAFRKAIDLGSTQAYVNLARLAWSQHEYAEAEDLLRKFLPLEPSNAEALFLLALADLQIGNYAETVTLAHKLHTLNPERFPFAHYAAAVALQAMHQNAEAAVEYSLFLKEAPNDRRAAEARKALAQIQEK
jgi:tetratricopeptide (TPR) repeat protein